MAGEQENPQLDLATIKSQVQNFLLFLHRDGYTDLTKPLTANDATALMQAVLEEVEASNAKTLPDNLRDEEVAYGFFMECLTIVRTLIES